jgi:hypothetical protein
VAADYEPNELTEAIGRLHRAGWSVGSTAYGTEAGGLTWVVSGANGEDPIEGRGATAAGAWRSALEQARALGMLDSIRPGRSGGGTGEWR